jgi:hypothetical protein
MRLVNSAGTKQNTADELEQHVLGTYFSLEWAGIWAFSLYWLVKTMELRKTQAVIDAAHGELEVAGGKVVRRRARK